MSSRGRIACYVVAMAITIAVAHAQLGNGQEPIRVKHHVAPRTQDADIVPSPAPISPPPVIEQRPTQRSR